MNKECHQVNCLCKGERKETEFKTEPCGTPQRISLQQEDWSFNTTLCLRIFREFWRYKEFIEQVGLLRHVSYNL